MNLFFHFTKGGLIKNGNILPHFFLISILNDEHNCENLQGYA
jgi:hypothetical protein